MITRVRQLNTVMIDGIAIVLVLILICRLALLLYVCPTLSFRLGVRVNNRSFIDNISLHNVVADVSIVGYIINI